MGPQIRDRSGINLVSYTGRWLLYHQATRKAQKPYHLRISRPWPSAHRPSPTAIPAGCPISGWDSGFCIQPLLSPPQTRASDVLPEKAVHLAVTCPPACALNPPCSCIQTVSQSGCGLHLRPWPLVLPLSCQTRLSSALLLQLCFPLIHSSSYSWHDSLIKPDGSICFISVASQTSGYIPVPSRGLKERACSCRGLLSLQGLPANPTTHPQHQLLWSSFCSSKVLPSLLAARSSVLVPLSEPLLC